MDLDLSDDQELFRDTTRKFLTANWPTSAARKLIDDPVGFDRTIWSRGADLGWMSMLVPEEHGGGSISGEAVSDLSIVAEELGRFVFAGPVLATNVVAFALATSGSARWPRSTCRRWPAVPRSPPGRSPRTTIAGGVDAVALDAIPAGDGFTLTGLKSPVQDAQVADHLLVSARTPYGPTQFLVIDRHTRCIDYAATRVGSDAAVCSGHFRWCPGAPVGLSRPAW